MLSDTDTVQEIIINYSGTTPAPTPQTLVLPSGPWRLSWIMRDITAAGAIVLPGLILADETGAQVFLFSILPWQFAGTTVINTISQTPDAVRAPLFAAETLAGNIPGGLHAFNGWTILFSDFLGTPGVTFDITLQFSRPDFDDANSFSVI